MAIPTHDQILSGLAGKRPAPQQPKLPQNKTLLQKGIDAVKATPKLLKDIFIPTRGYTEQQISQAKPTVVESLKAPLRLGAEMTKGAADLYALGKQITPKPLKSVVKSIVPGAAALDALSETAPAKTAYETIDEFSRPKTAGEAKSMRVADIASFGIGGFSKSLNKTISKLAATTDLAAISRELKATGVTDSIAQNYVKKIAETKDERTVSDLLTNALRESNYRPQIAVDDIVAKYTAAGPSKVLPDDFSRADDVLNEIISEMDVAEAGRRDLVTDADGYTKGVVGVQSTFPDWVPEHLRSRALFDSVTKDFNINNLQYPEAVKGRQRELYSVILDQLDQRLGVDTKSLRSYILEATARPNRLSELGAQGEDVARQARTTPSPQVVDRGTPPILPREVSESSNVSKTVAPLDSQSTLRGIKTNTIEFLQNSQERVRQLVKNPNIKISQVNDPYLKMTLYNGRLGDAIERATVEVQSIFDDMAKFAKQTNTKFDDTRKLVNEYLLLRHAPERNAAIGERAAGIGTDEAISKLKGIESRADAKEIRGFADRLSALNRQTLEMLKTSGVISEDTFNLLRERYKNHVPLNRIMNESEDIGGILSGKGYDVRSSGIKVAKGSEREVSDIVGNILHNYQQAALRSEKNIVDLATLDMVRKNKKMLEGIIDEVSLPAVPVAKIKDANDIEQTIYRRLQFTNDPTILTLMENGKRKFLKFKDPRLAAAFRGVNQEKLGSILQVVGAVSRYFSSLATRFNPEFFLPNKIRDLQETAVFLAAQKGLGFKGAAKMLTRDPQSIKDVLDTQRGLDTAGTRLYKEMRKLGGTTGGFGLSTKKQATLDIQKLEKLAKSSPRRALSETLRYIDNLNEIFEDSTRLSVYKEALARGLEKDVAAGLAKEASINFNRFGTGGPVINALYMFSNASIQGTAKTLRAMKNPKVAAAVVTTVGAAVAAVNEFNDTVDPQWREKVTEYDRMNGLPVMIYSDDPTKSKYITIPVSWGIKPIKVMSDYAYDAASGIDVDPATVLEKFVTSVIEAYNPTGGTDIVSAITPTILDIPAELSRNRAWSGTLIKPDYDPNAPESIKYFPSLKGKPLGEESIATTDALARLGVEISPADLNYAIEQLIGGLGRTVTRTVNTVTGIANGEPPPLSDFPLIGRFYRQRENVEVGAGSSSYNTIKKLKAEDSRERFNLKNQATTEWQSIKALPSAERKARLLEIAKTNEKLAEKILDIAEEDKLGLTAMDKQLRSATVATRAEYIQGQLELLKTREEKIQLLKDLARKKILTDSVMDELEKIK